ncbi:MAG: hypothetical protein Q6370_002580, partial [Candidatus Sigynarchaeota archaeon]
LLMLTIAITIGAPWILGTASIVDSTVAGTMHVAGLISLPLLVYYIPFMLEIYQDARLVQTHPLAREKHVLAYYYPWFHNGTNYTGALGDAIVEKGNATGWARWGSPEDPCYNYTLASSLTQQQVYYWRNGLERNYSWASIAHWPLDGLYDVSDPDQINRHFDRMNRAGIDVLIGDFFGDYEFQDPTMDGYLAVAANRSAEGKPSPKITFMLGVSWGPEQEWWGPTSRNGSGWGIISHAEYIYHYVKSYLDAHGNDAHFFRVNGKPVFFTWATYVPGYDVWKAAMAMLREDYDFYIVVDWGYQKPGPPGPEWVELFDGFVFYNPVGYLFNEGPVPNTPNKYANLWWLDWANSNDVNKGIAPEITRYGEVQSPTIRTMFRNMKRYYTGLGKFWAPTVIPGYDDRQIYPHANSFVGRAGTTNYGSKLTYDGMWEDALACEPAWVLICSWNEIHEGTEIDASVEYGDLFINRTMHYTSMFHAQ